MSNDGNGCVVLCIDSSNQELWLKRGAYYSLLAVRYQGMAFIVSEYGGPFSRDRFEVFDLDDFYELYDEATNDDTFETDH
jgi:hypothetical protein